MSFTGEISELIQTESKLMRISMGMNTNNILNIKSNEKLKNLSVKWCVPGADALSVSQLLHCPQTEH